MGRGHDGTKRAHFISYMAWGRHEHQPDSCALRPQSRPTLLTFSSSNLVTCKVMRSDFRSWCSWEESTVKWINLPWTNNTYVHYPTEEPKPTHVESFGPRVRFSDSFKLAQRSGTKIVSPRTPHEMSEFSNPTLVQSPWAESWGGHSIVK